MNALTEWYGEDVSLPRDSLTRTAEKLKRQGSLYLGGGIGVEQKKDLTYNVIGGGTHDGPLSAVTEALKLAGAKKAEGTPGGTAAVSDPAIAARLFELDAQEMDEKRTIQRMQRTLARNAKDGMAAVPSYGGISASEDDRWERRRIREAEERLKQIKQERKQLLAAKTEAEIKEALMLSEETGKPGTNWKQVGAADRKRINPIVKHYMGMAHPFTACVRDNTKRFGPERAKRVCAVVKDMGERRTTWRKGGKAREEEYVSACVEALLEAAGGDVEGLETMMLCYIAEQEVPKPTRDARERRKRKRRREAVLGRTSAGSTGDADATGVGVSESEAFLPPLEV